MSPITAQVTAGLDVLAGLEHEWRRLFDAADCEPSVSFDWTMALARTQLTAADSCHVIQLRQGERLVGVVPLFVRASRVFAGRHLIARPLAELKNTHSDLLLANRSPEAVAALLGACRRLGTRWDSLRLSKLVEGHPVTRLLEKAAQATGFSPRRRYRKAAYWLALPASYDEYFASRSAKFRNHARRAEKKLRAAGRVEEIEVTAPAGFDDAYDAVLQVERASWKEPHGTSISAVPAEAALYREWGRAAAVSGQLHLHLLMLDGEPIAHNLGCLHRGRYYYLKTSYAARHRPVGPATFLRLALIRRLIARGASEVDFCGTPYEWEQQWTSTYRWHHVLSIYADTLRGRLFSALDAWTHYSSAGQQVEHEDPRGQQALP